MKSQITITTNGGMILRAQAADVHVMRNGSLVAQWDMRHNLVHNPRLTYTVRPNDVKAVAYA